MKIFRGVWGGGGVGGNKIVWNRSKLSGPLHKYFSTLYCCRWQKFRHKRIVFEPRNISISLNSDTQDAHFSVLVAKIVTGTRHNITRYVYCLCSSSRAAVRPCRRCYQLMAWCQIMKISTAWGPRSYNSTGYFFYKQSDYLCMQVCTLRPQREKHKCDAKRF